MTFRIIKENTKKRVKDFIKEFNEHTTKYKAERQKLVDGIINMQYINETDKRLMGSVININKLLKENKK